MNIAALKVLITGASGGIGRALALELARGGASVLLGGREAGRLESLQQAIRAEGGRADIIVADLASAEGRMRTVRAAEIFEGGINGLINNAGRNSFGLFELQSTTEIEQTILVNALAPMLLTKALLLQLKRQDRAVIVNIGSVLGALATPGQVAYAASKAALKSFNEGLRRELAQSAVDVIYVAPRATDTAMNDSNARTLNEKLGLRVDTPEHVAAEIRRAISSRARERTIGWPEKLFVRVNAILPALADRSLRTQLKFLERGSRQDKLALTAGGDQ